MELEAQAKATAERYPLNEVVRGLNLDPREVIRLVVEDVLRGLPPGEISFKFHMLVADYVCFVAYRLREETGIRTVALGGGVFQNGLLTKAVLEELSSKGFNVLVPEQVPVNDGGISVGQAAHACAVLGGG
jgi:hydrogenase maturation protein HypF